MSVLNSPPIKGFPCAGADAKSSLVSAPEELTVLCLLVQSPAIAEVACEGLLNL